MLQQTIQKFKNLPKVVKSMIALFWVYELVAQMTTVFINAYIYLNTQSIEILIQYNFFNILGIGLGFVIWGYLIAYFQISFRLNYIKSFIIFIASFLVLIFLPKENFTYFLFALVNGLAVGMFWVGVHTYELIHTTDDIRDFYSSMISAGVVILKMLSPALAIFSFYISEHIFHFEMYTIFFIILPFLYLIALPFIFSLPEYIPEKIPPSSIKNLFSDKKIGKIRKYLFFSSIDFAILAVVFPIIAIQALSTPYNIGYLEFISGLIAFVGILYLSHQRNAENRTDILSTAIMGIFISGIIILLYPLHWGFYAVGSICLILLIPVYRVSIHVLDLFAMDKLKEVNNSIYESVLYRDFILFFARIFALLCMYICTFFVESEYVLIVIGLVTVMCSYLFTAFYAKKLR